MRVWLRFLAIAPALFAALFLFSSPASAVVFGGEAKAKSGVVLKTPKRVVMVVFDFATDSSRPLTDDERADWSRYLTG